MRRFISCLLFSLVCVGLATVSQAGLVVDELMVAPNSGDGGYGEWFEIFNTGPTAVDLSTIKYDVTNPNNKTNPTTGANGTSLKGILSAGQYAIIAAESVSAWATQYGGLPKTSLFFNPTSWKTLWDAGVSMYLYDTVAKKDIFSLTYSSSVITQYGSSLQYVGTDPNALVTASKSITKLTTGSTAGWQLATTSPGGTVKDNHSAGIANSAKSPLSFTTTAPEPASLAMLGMAGAGLVTVIRRQRREASVASEV